MTQHLENVQEQPRNRDEELREMTQQLTDVRRQLQERDGELSERTRQLTNTQGQLQERDGQLREKTQQLTDTQGQLQDKDKRLRQKTQQLTNVQEQLQEKDGQLREKTEQLASVVWQLQERDGQLREKTQQLASVVWQLQESDGQLREKTQQLASVVWQLQERDGQLRQKRNQLTDVRRQLHETNEELTFLKRLLRVKLHAIDELETSLSAAQRALNERSRPQTPDWVIPRDQIQLTDKCLGKGGWGSVIEGKYCGCAVAVKQMYELILSDHNRRLFEREMSIAARCRHPCMLQFIGATNDEESPLFVTELMQSSLRALLEQRRLSSFEVCVISLDVARALNYLHLQKPSPIIHRDISSANVLLWRQADQWRGKVSDYGTANVLQQTMTVSPGAMIYSAPEAHTEYQTVKVCLKIEYWSSISQLLDCDCYEVYS